MMGIKELEITQKMLRCQNAMKSLFGSEYNKKVQFWMDIIKNIAAKEKADILKATIIACEKADNETHATIWFMAAAVELIENNNP